MAAARDIHRARLRLSAEKALGSDAVWMGHAGRHETTGDCDLALATGSVRSTPVRRAAANPTLEPVMEVVATTPAQAFSGLARLAETPIDGPLLASDEKRGLLERMDNDEVKVCTRCPLHGQRRHTVFGEGDIDARLMFIGEGPGENEDAVGRPFVGRSGELLNQMITAMGLSREQVFIANVVKCRPPGNRTPMPDEALTCSGLYLRRQIEIIRPGVIVTLGLPATQFVMGRKIQISKVRGQWTTYRGIQVMPTYHPSYLLRNYTPAARREVWDDLQLAMGALGLASPKKPDKAREGGA